MRKMNPFVVARGFPRCVSFVAFGILGLIQFTQAAQREVRMNAARGEFEPSYLKIQPGDTVKFVLRAKSKTVRASSTLVPDGAFNWNSIPGKSFSVKLSREGIYIYQSDKHVGKGMVGVIRVGQVTNFEQAATKLNQLQSTAAKSKLTILLAQVREDWTTKKSLAQSQRPVQRSVEASTAGTDATQVVPPSTPAPAQSTVDVPTTPVTPATKSERAVPKAPVTQANPASSVPEQPDTASESPVLDAVIVTGERTGRSLAETSSSVTVLPEAEVRRRSGKVGVFSALDGAPNYTPSTPEELPPIRGERSSGPSFLGGAFLFGTTNRASLIVDDVARISSIANNSFQSIFDIEQVELLRGPQTTVRGANAIAGAYIVKTKDPTSKLEGEVFGQLDWNKFSGISTRFAAMGNAPLGEALAARVVVERRDGRVPVEVVDASGFDSNRPTPPPGTDLEALSEFDNTSLRGKLLFAPPGVPELDMLFSLQAERGLDVGFDSFVSSEIVHGRPLRDRAYVFGEQRIFDTRAQAFSVNTGWQFGGGSELRLIASTQKDEFKDNPRANEFVRFQKFDESLSTLDLLYKFGRAKTVLKGLVGATVSSRKQDGVTISFELTNRQRANSSAIFADLAIPFGDRWRLLAGGRVQRENGRRVFDFSGLSQIDDRTNETVFLPKLGVSVEIDANQTASLTLRRGYNPGGAGIDFISLEAFKFESEKVTALEFSHRFAPSDDSFSLNTNLFYNDFDDKQFQFSPTPESFRIINQPKSRSYGLELEGQWQAMRALRLAAGLGLLRTRITDGDPALVGNRFGEDPNTTLSLSALWTPLTGVEVNARGYRVAGYFSDFQNADSDRGGGYTIVDLGASYAVGGWTMRAFINNATDELAIGRGSAFGAYLLPPRVAGLSASVKF
jgi:iron complex outermembrane recepter protein